MIRTYPCLFFLLFFNLIAHSQSTYTWNVTRGDWNTASNWNPARTAPATNDILIINGSVTANACITNIPKSTIGRLRIINNANVRFVAGPRILGTGLMSRSGQSINGQLTQFNTELREGDLLFAQGLPNFYGEVFNITSAGNATTNTSGTLSNVPFEYAASINISASLNNALEIESGSTLSLGDSLAEPLVVRMLNGAKAELSGTVRMLYTRQRLVGLDSSSIVVKSTGIIRNDSTFVGNPFLNIGRANVVVFEAGSRFEYVVGTQLFGLTQPASKVTFLPGSNYVQLSTNTPGSAGRVYANFIYAASGLVNIQHAGTLTIDSLIVQSGTLSINSSSTTNIGYVNPSSGALLNLNTIVGNINIRKSILVNGTLNLNGKFTTAPANVNLNGTSLQTISGSGLLRIGGASDSIVRFRIQNPAGVQLNRNLELNGAYLHLDSGTLQLNNNNITVGNNLFHGKIISLNGAFSGAGNITRWYIPSVVDLADSAIFPFQTASGNFSAWVGGTTTTAGTVTLTNVTDNSAITSINPSFNDVAPFGTVNINRRLNHSWTLQSGNGLAGTYQLRLTYPALPSTVNTVEDIRICLSNSAAPGTSQNGSGTVNNPQGLRSNLTPTQLNNTFFIGSNNSGNPLPVEFLSVVGKLNKDIAHLNWVVTSERNVSHYNVKYKYDNEPFVVLGKVMANGNTAVKQTYTYESEKGAGCYMIEAVDFDGETTLSSLVCLTNTNNYGLVSIFPNPAKQSVNISGLNSTETIILELYSVKGEMYNITVKDGVADISNLPEGIYAGLITQGEQRLKVRIVKQQ